MHSHPFLLSTPSNLGGLLQIIYLHHIAYSLILSIGWLLRGLWELSLSTFFCHVRGCKVSYVAAKYCK